MELIYKLGGGGAARPPPIRTLVKHNLSEQSNKPPSAVFRGVLCHSRSA